MLYTQREMYIAVLYRNEHLNLFIKFQYKSVKCFHDRKHMQRNVKLGDYKYMYLTIFYIGMDIKVHFSAFGLTPVDCSFIHRHVIIHFVFTLFFDYTKLNVAHDVKDKR